MCPRTLSCRPTRSRYLFLKPVCISWYSCTSEMNFFTSVLYMFCRVLASASPFDLFFFNNKKMSASVFLRSSTSIHICSLTSSFYKCYTNTTRLFMCLLYAGATTSSPTPTLLCDHAGGVKREIVVDRLLFLVVRREGQRSSSKNADEKGT